ncbi:MAG: hypothetical protein J6R81_00170 [Alistipes sp.]|nr:hypothetical protein [Alistipes sp.]
MMTKLKIALLTLLGFSTAACCTTKKASGKKQDNEGSKIEADSVDTRIMLMYGVPFPNGSTVTPLSDEEAQSSMQEIRTEEPAAKTRSEADTIKVNKGPARFPDGRIAAPLTDEEAAKRVAEMEAKAAQKE